MMDDLHKQIKEEYMNRKGFTGLETVLAIGVIGLLIGLFAPKTVASFGDVFNGGNKNQTKQVHKLEEKYTIGRLDTKGHFVKLGDYSKKEDLQNLVAQQAPEKWSTKVKIILGLIVVLAIAFPTVATNMIIKAKSNLKQIITGVALAKTQMTPEQIKILETSLSKKTDLSTKAVVKKIVPTISAEELK
jgi:competence protein ComGC